MKKTDRYSDYTQYIEHQPSKLTPALERRLMSARSKRVAWFSARFSGVPFVSGTILCLGARLGEEVEALRGLGFSGALGLDLREWPPYVEVGDMNRLDGYADGSVSSVYSNALDHCWELDGFLTGVRRVVAAGGVFAVHMDFGLGPYETHGFESVDEVRGRLSRYFEVERSTDISGNRDTAPSYLSNLRHEFVLRRV